jgi:Putative F0F1-ATPase subunit Ca2+/Mg2+ transporter
MRGYADTLSRAFEWALTTAIFLGVGIVLDRVLGTAPVFVIVLTLFGVAGQFTRMWYAYAGQMREHEAAVPSGRAAVRPRSRHATEHDRSGARSPATARERVNGTMQLAPATSTESAISLDLARRGAIVLPAFLVYGALVGRGNGAASAAAATRKLAHTRASAAALMTVSARISLTALMGAVLGGYVVRLGAITGVIVALRHQSWFHRGAFAVTLLVTHLGLLVWETRHVSISLAYPGLKPKLSKSRNKL